MLEKPWILNHFKNEKGKSEVPSPSCSGEGKVVQSVDEKYEISGHKQSLSLVLEPQIPIHRLPLPPQGEIPAENGGLSGKKVVEPSLPLCLAAGVQMLPFSSHHNNAVIQLGSTRWSE